MKDDAIDLTRPAQAILAQAGNARIARATEVELTSIHLSKKTGVLSAFAVGSETEEGRPLYQLRMDQGGWLCDCWDFMRRGGACKHITALALHAINHTNQAGFPDLKQSQRRFLSIRNACKDVEGFDEQCKTIAMEYAGSREVVPHDFVRAARTVALMNGKTI